MTRISIIFLLILTASCQQRPMKLEDAVIYIAKPKHGLVKEQKVSNFDIKVAYRPNDFVIAQFLQADTDKSAKHIEELRTKYGKFLYFIITMKGPQGEVLTSFATDKERFAEMVNKLSFGLGDALLLTTSNNDTLQLADIAYPRAYGMSGSTDILVAFDRGKADHAEQLKFKIKEIGLNTGDITYTFNMSDINKAPKLKLK